MKLQGFTKKSVVTCDATDTLDVPAKRMWDNDCGSVPVLDDDGRIVGMITDRDICMAALTQGIPLGAISVSSAMSPMVYSLRPDDSVDHAMMLMRQKQIRRIPITDSQGRPVGFLSVGDLARMVSSTVGEGTDLEFVQTLSAISQPRHNAEIAADSMFPHR